MDNQKNIFQTILAKAKLAFSRFSSKEASLRAEAEKIFEEASREADANEIAEVKNKIAKL